MTSGIDDTIHQKTRLEIMAHLAAVGEADFVALRNFLKLTDGNLSVHAGILEQKGYISSTRSLVGKKTRTTYSLTHLGRKAFEKYVAEIESILRSPTTR